MNQTLHNHLKSAIAQSLSQTQTPGAAVAVRLNGKPLFETGVGYQDLNQDVPMPTDASFYIYSITKSLLATALLDFVSKGILNLDASARSYLPDFSLDPSITLRHLLSHTSGLSDYGEMPAYSNAVKATPSAPWSSERFLTLALNQGLRFAPGTGWAYSNLGYLILKCILERAAQLSLQQLLHRVVFSPLSLQKTFVPNTLGDVLNLTPGYTALFGGMDLQDMTALYHPGWVSHGVVVSTAPELARMIEALFLNQILSSALVEQMLSPIHVFGKHPLFEKLASGLGLFVDLESPYGRIGGHTGEGPGYSVAAFHFPNLCRSRITISAVSNQDRVDQGLMMVYRMVEIMKELLESK